MSPESRTNSWRRSIRLSSRLRNRSLSPSAGVGTGFGRMRRSSRFERESQPRRRGKSRGDPAYEIASFFTDQAQIPANPNTLGCRNRPEIRAFQSSSRATSHDVGCGSAGERSYRAHGDLAVRSESSVVPSVRGPIAPLVRGGRCGAEALISVASRRKLLELLNSVQFNPFEYRPCSCL